VLESTKLKKGLVHAMQSNGPLPTSKIGRVKESPLFLLIEGLEVLPNRPVPLLVKEAV